MAGTAAPRAASGICRGAALLGFILAVAALLMLAAGPIGWRAGWWHYRIGLQILLPSAGYVGIAAIAVSALALIFAIRAGARRGLVLALLGLVIGAVVAYFPWHWNNLRGAYPTLNDVTSDTDNPPSLAFSEAMRAAERGNPLAYGGAERARVQKKFYPDIAPARLDLPPAEAFERALAVATARGWTIVKTDPAAGVIDAFERSRWFGFTDDIAIRVTTSEGGSRVDIRSAARQGRGDFGVNAMRVRNFLAALRSDAGK